MKVINMPKCFIHGDAKTGIVFKVNLIYYLPDGIEIDESLLDSRLGYVLAKLFRRCVIKK